MMTPRNPKQREVTEFYDRLVFPSRSSSKAYSDLIPAGQRGLIGDFGCGQSLFYDRLKCQERSPTFLDISMNALKTIDYGLRIKASLCALPIKADAYDFIICIGVVHHLPEMDKAIQEMSRVAKVWGVVVLGVYTPGSLQHRIRRLYDSLSQDWTRAIVFQLTSLLILAKNLRNGRGVLKNLCKRTSDLLQTPLVRYEPAERYIALAEKSGLRLLQQSRISSMTILKFEKR
jgi:SAM-dependent methyltransferase